MMNTICRIPWVSFMRVRLMNFSPLAAERSCFRVDSLYYPADRPGGKEYGAFTTRHAWPRDRADGRGRADRSEAGDSARPSTTAKGSHDGHPINQPASAHEPTCPCHLA